MLERIDDRLVNHRWDGALDRIGNRPHAGVHVDGERHLPFERDPLPQGIQAGEQRALRPRRRSRFQAVDEHPELALLDRERSLDGQQAVALRARRLGAELHRDVLKLQADARQRLEHAVVQIASDVQALFAGGNIPQVSAHRQLLERAPDLAADHPGQRQQLRGRRREIGEENAAGDSLGVERRGDQNPPLRQA